LAFSNVVESLSIRESPVDPKLARGQEGWLAPAAFGHPQMRLILVLLMLFLLPAVSFAQEPSPSPSLTPATQNLKVPAVAPDYQARQTPLPDLGRVGVDMDQQQPLSLREALKLALDNKKDIEVARENVKLAEFDLLGAHGAYDPRLSAQTYYERFVVPNANFLGGGTNGAVTSSDYTGTFRLDGLSPKGGGSYRLDFSSVRSTTDNQFAALDPQYPTAFTFTFTQPLRRGRSIDNPRRQIEIARKNLSLTDTQFRQRAIETITNVQRAYWDLVFACALQVQRDAVRDARTQLDHNKRLVIEGQLAPIDVVAADAQVTSFEQSLFSALEDVSRAENALKSLIAQNAQASIWTASVVPTDAVDLTPPQISLPEAMKLALDNRPELQQSNLASEINQIDQHYYRDQTKARSI
jgi:HAE1 family hydrophobic/amphiphilic exporter-1